MDSVNFLNIEYIVLRLSELFSRIFGPILGLDSATGIQSGPSGSTTLVSSEGWFVLGQFALAGMALAFVLLVVSVYVRIKLELFEHEEFHKRDAKYHTHSTHAHPTEGHIPVAVPEVKNPRWQEVVRLSSSESESDWRRAIMEADILLGELLQQQGYRGNTIGERLKDANPLQFTTLDLAWKAHKVRNDVAHGGEGFHLSQWDVKATIDFYRRVFEEFDFI